MSPSTALVYHAVQHRLSLRSGTIHCTDHEELVIRPGTLVSEYEVIADGAERGRHGSVLQEERPLRDLQQITAEIFLEEIKPGHELGGRARLQM